MIAFAPQIKIPAFHTKSPLSMNFFARVSSGFSVKVLTFLAKLFSV
jgi:hypothetical protein